MSKRDHGQESDSEKYLRYLVETDPLREQMNLDIVKWLDLPVGSRGLDLGCGGGTQALMLANAVGPEGHVTGFDIRPEFLKYAREVTANKGLSHRVSFEEGDLNRLPFEDATFDWIWSSDCIGYLSPSEEVVRVIRPGGTLNLSFWSSDQLLPGYPILEAHLKATNGGIAPFVVGNRPESHHFRTLAKLEALGLTDLKAMTFTTSVFAPLGARMRQAMIDILEMRWPDAESELLEEESELYRRLTDPDSPEFILNLPGYYAFYTYSVFTGRVIRERAAELHLLNGHIG
jgi:ubiquinone/menaquinone biosynthesis C-methylase UbiE